MPIDDPFWRAAADHVAGLGLPAAAVFAPAGFETLLPGCRTPRSAPAAALPRVLVLHKGRMDEVPSAILLPAFDALAPSFANEVFMVLADTGEPLAPDSRHLLSRDALLAAALERWEAVEQETVFGQLEAVSDPRQRLRKLFHVVAHEVKPHKIYSELLKALDHAAVGPVIERVSQRRLEYLAASFRQSGLVRTDAQHRARLAYAAYVGFLQLRLQLHNPRLAQDEFEAYVEHVMDTLIPPVPAPRA